MREDFNNVIDRKTISIYNIDFFNVANIVTCDIINIKDKKENIIVVIMIENVKKNKIDEISEITTAIVIEIFFACFLRTYSCNLILLSNFLKYCLQTNVSIFFFVIRVSFSI